MALETSRTRPGGPPLLASRLVAPAPPEPLVLRPRLLRRLDEGTGGPVTLVRAPAGWGKTTLLASWVRAAGADRVPVWLSVEAGDTGERLWTYLAAALDPPDGPAGGPAGGPADGPAGPPDGPTGGPLELAAPVRAEQLERLAAALAGRDRPVVLVLDDLHRITEPAALAGLEFLLRHGDQRLRLVIGARVDPTLPLHRWRLRGELTSLDADDLAFTADEVADLLTAHGVAAPPATVPLLRERTGGWAAGLRFAALAARAAADPARLVAGYAGDQPDVADYLRAEVLTELTDDDADLLRRSAVAETVCGSLADTLTGRPGGDALLADLVRAGGFVRSDGLRPGWYRCHPLLTDLLRTDLARLPAAELRELHRRAAGWYADNGRPAAALRHALAAGEWDRATALVLADWPELLPYGPEPPGPLPTESLSGGPLSGGPLSGGPLSAGPLPGGPFSGGPSSERIGQDPELALALAVERAAADHAAATGQLRDAVAAARTLPTPRRDRFGMLAAALEMTLAQLAGDHDEARAAAARLRAAANLGDDGTGPPAGGERIRPGGEQHGGHRPGHRDPDGDPRCPGGDPRSGADPRCSDGDPRSGAGDRADVRLVAGVVEALADLAEGRLHRAGVQFQTLAEAARAAGRPRVELVCRSRAALAAAWWGSLREAERAAGETLGGAAATPGDLDHAYLALALAALHRDRPDEVETHLDRTVLGGADLPDYGLSGADLADYGLSGADLAGSGPSGCGLAGAGPGPAVLAGVAAYCRAYLLRARGDAAGAHRALTRAREAGPGGREVTDRLLAAEADLAAARGDPTTARELLRPPAAGPAPELAVALVPELAVALAWVEVGAGDLRAAAVLPPWDGPDAARWPLPIRLDAGLVDVLLARRGGDPRRAGRLLERLLGLAEPEGHRRVFTQPGIRDLLAEHLDTGTAHWPFIADLLHDSAPVAEGGAEPARHRPGEPDRGPAEPLTERELTILRYLQSILSNVEIASELSLSVNTVKTHVRNIYRKLDATRRREAVRRARELHLI